MKSTGFIEVRVETLVACDSSKSRPGGSSVIRTPRIVHPALKGETFKDPTLISPFSLILQSLPPLTHLATS
jgi:hypothetical protein